MPCRCPLYRSDDGSGQRRREHRRSHGEGETDHHPDDAPDRREAARPESSRFLAGVRSPRGRGRSRCHSFNRDCQAFNASPPIPARIGSGLVRTRAQELRTGDEVDRPTRQTGLRCRSAPRNGGAHAAGSGAADERRCPGRGDRPRRACYRGYPEFNTDSASRSPEPVSRIPASESRPSTGLDTDGGLTGYEAIPLRSPASRQTRDAAQRASGLQVSRRTPEGGNGTGCPAFVTDYAIGSRPNRFSCRG
jgi:hypothetical protein